MHFDAILGLGLPGELPRVVYGRGLYIWAFTSLYDPIQPPGSYIHCTFSHNFFIFESKSCKMTERDIFSSIRNVQHVTAGQTIQHLCLVHFSFFDTLFLWLFFFLPFSDSLTCIIVFYTLFLYSFLSLTFLCFTIKSLSLYVN